MRTKTGGDRGLLDRREIKRLSFVSQKLTISLSFPFSLCALLSRFPFGRVETRGCNGGTKEKEERKGIIFEEAEKERGRDRFSRGICSAEINDPCRKGTKVAAATTRLSFTRINRERREEARRSG